MSDDLNEMARLAAADRGSAMDARIARERRAQLRARRVRATCRWIMAIGGIAGVGCLLVALSNESGGLIGLACMLLIPAMIAAAALFFMGGLSPNWVRSGLSDRERDLLDH